MADTKGRAGSLFFGMTLKTSDFKKNLKGIRKDLKSAGKAMRASFAAIATAGAAVATAFAAGAIGLLAFAKNTAQATNEQLLLADSLGATQAEIASLEVASTRFGVSQDMLIDKMREAGGVDAFKDIADQVKSAGDESAQLAKAQELLGNEGLKLLPILQQGAAGLSAMEKEAFDLGLALNPAQIAETRVAWGAFEDTMLRLKGLGKQIGTSLLEPFTLATGALDAFLKTFKSEIMGGFESLSNSLTSAMKTGIQAFIDFGIPLIVALMSFADSLGQTFSDVFGFISSEGKGAFSTIKDLFNGFIDFLAVFKQVFIAGISTAVSTVLTGTFNGLAKFSDFVGKLVSEIAFMLEGLGLEDEGFGHEVTVAFKEQSKAIRGMGEELAKPFKQAAEDNINEASKILEKNEKKTKKFQSTFGKSLKTLMDGFGKASTETIEKAAKKATEIAGNVASGSRASMILTGSQEEARILAGQSDKNLKLQQDIRNESKRTNQILMRLGTV